jgi:hypothetical protein
LKLVIQFMKWVPNAAGSCNQSTGDKVTTAHWNCLPDPGRHSIRNDPTQSELAVDNGDAAEYRIED